MHTICDNDSPTVKIGCREKRIKRTCGSVLCERERNAALLIVLRTNIATRYARAYTYILVRERKKPANKGIQLPAVPRRDLEWSGRFCEPSETLPELCRILLALSELCLLLSELVQR